MLSGTAVANLLVPGCGLILRDHLAVGLGCLLPALLALAVLILSFLLTAAELAWQLRSAAALGYLLLAVLAGWLWWRRERRRPWQREAVIGLHREFAIAYLRNDPAGALAAAERLVRAAPDLVGTWRVLAFAAAEAGDRRRQRRASKRQRQLHEREQLRHEREHARRDRLSTSS